MAESTHVVSKLTVKALRDYLTGKPDDYAVILMHNDEFLAPALVTIWPGTQELVIATQHT